MLRTFARKAPAAVSCRVRFGSSQSTGSAEVVAEDFSGPIWRKAAIFGLLSYATYKADEVYASRHEGEGYFTMLFRRWRPQEGLWEQRNIKHYDLATEAAEDRLLLQSAQAPTMRQMRYPAVLDHGSPYNTRVDQKVDNSHVKVKQRNQVAQAGAEVRF